MTTPGTHVTQRRWPAFGAVAVLGFIVQLTALFVLVGWFEIAYLPATALAVELAILHNFFWHQRWTWSDRGTMSARQTMERLLRFNAGTAVTSITGNVVLMWVLVSALGLHYAIANTLAVLSLSIVNFVFYDRVVFRLGRNRLWLGPGQPPSTRPGTTAPDPDRVLRDSCSCR